MKIKTKLNLGVGLLFSLIILLGVVSINSINNLKKDTENILVANYNTLQYTRNMLVALDENNRFTLSKFEHNLNAQEKNITEPGEKEVTVELKTFFKLFKKDTQDISLLPLMRKNIFHIMELNMDALQRKGNLAKESSSKAIFYIIFTGTLCFLIAFVLLINLPSNIANPIKELTESISKIAAKKYSERVRFEGHNEFGELAKSFNTMAMKMEEYNNSSLTKMMMEKKRVETLIDNMHDPVIILDQDLKIIFINDESLSVVGMSRESIIGESAKKIALENDLIRSLIQDLVKSPQEIKKSKSMKIFANDKESYFEKENLVISYVPTGEDTSQMIGYVIILRNITEYKELDLAKTSFIATVSHEFKTPISSIKMSLQLLENEQIGKLNNDQKNLVHSINEDTSRLLRITGELLNITQVESGNIQLSIFPSKPEEMMNYAMNATKSQAEQKNIKFVTIFDTILPMVQADHEKTSWVLTNLISNAIKYSYENSKIDLGIQSTDDYIVLSVKDYGQGIAPQYHSKIFDRYFRVPGSQKEGSGLGLSISKEFIEAEGGILKVDSEYGVGSTFFVKLKKV